MNRIYTNIWPIINALEEGDERYVRVAQMMLQNSASPPISRPLYETDMNHMVQ